MGWRPLRGSHPCPSATQSHFIDIAERWDGFPFFEGRHPLRCPWIVFLGGTPSRLWRDREAIPKLFLFFGITSAPYTNSPLFPFYCN